MFYRLHVIYMPCVHVYVMLKALEFFAVSHSYLENISFYFSLQQVFEPSTFLGYTCHLSSFFPSFFAVFHTVILWMSLYSIAGFFYKRCIQSQAGWLLCGYCTTYVPVTLFNSSVSWMKTGTRDFDAFCGTRSQQEIGWHCISSG